MTLPLLALLCHGCAPSTPGWPGPPGTRVWVLDAGGPVRISVEPPPFGVEEAIRDRGARDLGCPVSVRRLGRVAVVEGCGKRALYLGLQENGEADRLPEHVGQRVPVYAVSVVPMSGDRGAAKLAAQRFVDDIGLKRALRITGDPKLDELLATDTPLPFFADGIDRYFELQAQGARDLGCPAEQILPSFEGRDSSTPVAEGCGKRATYLPALPLRLSAVVSTAP